MIPQIVTIRYMSSPGKNHRIWVPLLHIYLILTPFLPFILVALVIACARYRINPLRALTALTRMFASLGGFRVDVTHRSTNVAIKLT
jgi:hypothetical protein